MQGYDKDGVSTEPPSSESGTAMRQQTQPTYDTGTRKRTRATLVEGECSQHCAIPAPPTSC